MIARKSANACRQNIIVYFERTLRETTNIDVVSCSLLFDRLVKTRTYGLGTQKKNIIISKLERITEGMKPT